MPNINQIRFMKMKNNKIKIEKLGATSVHAMCADCNWIEQYYNDNFTIKLSKLHCNVTGHTVTIQTGMITKISKKDD